MKQMKEKKDSNQEIKPFSFYDIGKFLPQIYGSEDKEPLDFTIKTEIPRESHEKWIGHINNLEEHRTTTVNRVEKALSHYQFKTQTYLLMTWDKDRVSFETDGLRCGLHLVKETDFYGYDSHNIHNFEQMVVLFIALSIYLQEIYKALELFKQGKIDSNNYEPLTETIRNKIRLKSKLKER